MLCLSVCFCVYKAKCIDFYTKQRVANAEASESDQKEIDPRLEDIVNRMFQRCFDDCMYKQAVGIALETRRVDIFEDAIMKSVSACRDARGSLVVSLNERPMRGISWFDAEMLIRNGSCLPCF